MLFLGLLLRFLYFAERSQSAFFNVPLLDEKFYDAAASGLLGQGQLGSLDASFRSLGYPVFLALWYQLGGDSGRILATCMQHLLGLGTALLVALLSFRLFRNHLAAAAAAAIYLFAGPPLYFEGELLAETLFTFEVALVAFLLARCGDGRGLFPWILAGTAIGLACETRPNALLTLGALFALALFGQNTAGHDDDKTARWRAAAAGGLATLAVLCLAAWLQMPWVGRFELLPSQGGVNFYLGNRAGADGMIPRQSAATSYGDAYRDSVQVWAEQEYRLEGGRETASPGEISRFYTRKALHEIVADPAAWLELVLRKVVYLISNTEIPNNKSYSFALAEESRLLPLLPMRFFLLFALAGAGAFIGWRHGERRVWLSLLLPAALLAAGAIAFFVNARFRLPLWPLLAALGGGILLWRGLGRGERAVALGLALLLGTLSLVAPPSQEQLPGPGRDLFFRSLAYFEKGAYALALADAEQAVLLEPNDAAAIVQLGNVALALGDTEKAYAAFGRAIWVLPAEPRGFNNLGLVFEKLGKYGDAYAAYLRAIDLSTNYSPPLINAALLELRAGLLDRAEVHLEQAAASQGDSVPYLCARAFLLQGRGRLEEATRLLEEATRRDEETTAQLYRENQSKLKLVDGLPKD